MMREIRVSGEKGETFFGGERKIAKCPLLFIICRGLSVLSYGRVSRGHKRVIGQGSPTKIFLYRQHIDAKTFGTPYRGQKHYSGETRISGDFLVQSSFVGNYVCVRKSMDIPGYGMRNRRLTIAY